QNRENMCRFTPQGLGLSINGSMSEYIKVKADRVHILPKIISFEEGCLIEPLAIGISSVEESGAKFGDSAVVYGARSIGLMVI
ncbi:MAG: hypothetical protein ACFFCM_22720, partial [Promethearchaeota archaeon]